MIGPSALTPYFRKIEAYGGYGTCCVNFTRGGADPGTQRERISGLTYRVDIMVPFVYHGRELIGVGAATVTDQVAYLIKELSELDYAVQQGRVKALRLALAKLEQDIRMEMLRARPTTTPNRQNKKIRSIFRSISVLGLVPDKKEGV